MNWERDELLAKARLFAERGMEVERDSGLVPFWCTLSLELLARAALAHIHPVLLADPQQGENLLYAFGYPATNPRSIQTKTVLSRCQVVVERFTKAEEEFCASLLFLRNEELHTGTAAFENLPTSQWLVKFFYACQILLEHMGLDLSDLLPPDEVGPAQMMLNADAESVRSEVLEAIGRARSDFLALDGTEQERLETLADEDARDRRAHEGMITSCPACQNQGIVDGEILRATDPHLVGDLLKWETVILPTSFQCTACGLVLNGFNRMEAASIGGQHTLEHWEDPVDYYGEQALGSYREPEYGND